MGRFLAELYEGAERIDVDPAGGPKDPLTVRIKVSPASAVPAVDVLVSRVESLVT